MKEEIEEAIKRVAADITDKVMKEGGGKGEEIYTYTEAVLNLCKALKLLEEERF